MKKIITLLSLFSFLTIGLTFVSCGEDAVDVTPDIVDPEPDPEPDPEDPDEEEEIGIYGVKYAEMEINNLGGELSVSFLSLGDWSVESDSEWCEVLVESGDAGDAVITLMVAPNPDDEQDRTAVISIEVEGFKDMDLCEVFQSSSIEDGITGNDTNMWISDYMSTHYLWNDEYNKVRSTLNHWISDASTFLSTAMSRMSNIDEDGGYYASSGERYYYTNLEVYTYSYGAPAISTRAMTVANDYGIDMLYPVDAGSGNYYYWVTSVVDESPAYYAGIKRGMFITSYNNMSITTYNLDESYYALMGYSGSTDMVALGLAQYQEQLGGGYSLVAIDGVTVTPTNYTYNPIIFKAVFQKEGFSNVIGYMVYDEFDMNADDQLVQLFQTFKSYNVTDLILDLRYNGGGDVYASTVLASAITGNSHKGDVYCHMEYNDYRKAKGEVDYFYIGEDPSMVAYSPIADACSTGLGLERVYVVTTNFTASASELVINGLRGMGVEVIVVGQTTEGKNVGMEVISSLSAEYSGYDFGEYVYAFAPITFYNRNAVGFKEFSTGFTPDFEYVETSDIIFDWEENADMCVNAAAYHIYYGEWPSTTSATQSRANSIQAPLQVVDINGLRPQSKGSVVLSRDFIQSKL